MPPESPQLSSFRFGSREEKWINSATLFEAPEIATSSPSPRTPEPSGPFLPAFTLSTPSARSPYAVRSSPSTGSPLAPLQFMRRANPEIRRVKVSTSFRGVERVLHLLTPKLCPRFGRRVGITGVVWLRRSGDDRGSRSLRRRWKSARCARVGGLNEGPICDSEAWDGRG